MILQELQKLKNVHYFLKILNIILSLEFPQRAGALREFVADILGPDDDITHFEYTKKTK